MTMGVMSRRFAVLATVGALMAVPMGVQAWGNERVRGEGEVATVARDVSSFESVAVRDAFDVRVKTGTQIKVRVLAQTNLQPYIETSVESSADGPRLVVRTKKGYALHAKKAPVIEIEVPSLKSASLTGAGDLHVTAMTLGEFKAELSGAGDLHLEDVQAKALSLSLSGAGDVRARGQTQRLDVSLAGAGDVRAKDLKADDVKVAIAGAGDVTVQAVKTLDVSIAGAGDVKYIGNPQLTRKIAGFGSIQQIR